MARQNGERAGHSPIDSKPEFYRLWKAGVLGNRPVAWTTLDEALRSGSPNIAFREVGAGGGWWELVSRAEASATAERWSAAGRRYTLDAAVPNDRCVLLGEVARTIRGLEGTMAIQPHMSMREAIRTGRLRPVGGSQVLALTEHYMDPSSRDDLWSLLELFDDHVVEFASFDCDVGVTPFRNTIFWECRSY